MKHNMKMTRAKKIKIKTAMNEAQMQPVTVSARIVPVVTSQPPGISTIRKISVKVTYGETVSKFRLPHGFFK